MPFNPDSFFQNLAKYPKLLKIIDDLTIDYEKQEKSVGGKDDLQDLADQIKKRKFFDSKMWDEREVVQEDAERLREKWLSFWAGYSGDEELKHLKISLDLNPATVEAYKIMGRKFRRELESHPKMSAEDREEIRAVLNRYTFLIGYRPRITCGKCGHKYYADDAVNRNDQIRCPECNTRFPFSS